MSRTKTLTTTHCTAQYCALQRAQELRLHSLERAVLALIEGDAVIARDEVQHLRTAIDTFTQFYGDPRRHIS